MPHHGCNKQQEQASGRCHRHHCDESDSENEGGPPMRGFRGMHHRGPYQFGHHGMRGGHGAHHCLFREHHGPGHHHGMPGGQHHPGHFRHFGMGPNADFGFRRGGRGHGHFPRHHGTFGGPSFEHGPHRHPHCRAESGPSQDQGCRFAQRQRQRRHSETDVVAAEKHQCKHHKH